MKLEWRKHEKHLYLPKNNPESIKVPKFSFFTISGQGNPNDESFADYIEVLYSVSYAVRMCTKHGFTPVGYYEYTVYPLEGVWDITDEAKNLGKQAFIDKNILVFELMIRQPDFLTSEFATQIIERLMNKKPHPLLNRVAFKEIEEGNCIQMMHLGSYDNEPASFALMETFAAQCGLKRKLKTHREIYLTDARKTKAENLRTVLRFEVE